jgi:hypothetical protein
MLIHKILYEKKNYKILKKLVLLASCPHRVTLKQNSMSGFIIYYLRSLCYNSIFLFSAAYIIRVEVLPTKEHVVVCLSNNVV